MEGAMKVGLLGTGFGIAHAQIYHTHPQVSEVVVLGRTPARLHAEHVLRALQAGKHVLCELPLAATMDDAGRIVDAAAASDRQVFVDMFGRFDPATEYLHTAIADGRYGTLKTLTMELRSALLWEGYQIGLDRWPWMSCTAAW